jgi:hypothetical protein
MHLSNFIACNRQLTVTISFVAMRHLRCHRNFCLTGIGSSSRPEVPFKVMESTGSESDLGHYGYFLVIFFFAIPSIGFYS